MNYSKTLNFFNHVDDNYGDLEEIFSQLCMEDNITSAEKLVNVQEFLQKHPEVKVNALSEYSDNGFIQSAFYGDDKVIKLLLTKNIEQNVKNIALVLACQTCNSVEVVDLLLEHGANVNTNYLEDQPMPIVQCLTLYKKFPEKATPVVKKLLDNGADLALSWPRDSENTASSFIALHKIDMTAFNEAETVLVGELETIE